MITRLRGFSCTLNHEFYEQLISGKEVDVKPDKGIRDKRSATIEVKEVGTNKNVYATFCKEGERYFLVKEKNNSSIYTWTYLS